MLRNVSAKAIKIMWNGYTRFLQPGDVLETDKVFNVSDKKLLLAMEDKFVSKFGGDVEKYSPAPIRVPDLAQEVPATNLEDAEEEEIAVVPVKKRGRPKGKK